MPQRLEKSDVEIDCGWESVGNLARGRDTVQDEPSGPGWTLKYRTQRTCTVDLRDEVTKAAPWWQFPSTATGPDPHPRCIYLDCADTRFVTSHLAPQIFQSNNIV